MNKVGSNKKFHYAWVIVVVGFLMVFVSLGFINSPKSLYLVPITEETGLSRTIFSLNDVFRFVVVGVMNIFFGFFVKRINPRVMVALGFTSLTVAVLMFSFSSEAVFFCIGGILLGIGFSWTTTTMVGYFVEKWFSDKKGFIMGIMLAASGAGGAVATQILSPIIASSVSGWRLSYRITAIIVGAVGTLVVLLIRNKPADKGLEPLGSNMPAKQKRGNSWVGFEESSIYRKPWFYALIVCMLLYGALFEVYVCTSPAHLKDIGFDESTIANVHTIYLIFLFIAKMSAGALFDRIGLRRVFFLCSICGAAALAFLAFIGNTPLVYLYAPVSAFALPTHTVLMPLLALELFGKKAYTKTMGIFAGVMELGLCLGSVCPNFFYDVFGTYKGVYIACAVLTVVTLIVVNVCITCADKERRELEAQLAK